MTVRRWGGGAATAVTVIALISAAAAPPPPPKRWSRPDSTVVVHGRDRSFGALGEVLGSGQEVAKAPVNGWGFPAGRWPGRTAVTADGTVLMASTALTIAVYDPRGNASTTIRLPGEGEAAVTDLLPLSENAVAFTVASTEAGPVFGVLTKAKGVWQAAPANLFTGAQLGVEGLQRLVRLPGSGRLLLVNSAVHVANLLGPDAAGHYQPEITAEYRYPLAHIGFSAATLQVDPAGVPGDERFVVGLRNTANEQAPKVLQQFSFDDRQASIRPVSAPLLPGEFEQISGRTFGFDHAIYDGSGNLWATTSLGPHAGRMIVYARETPPCSFSPAKALDRYVTKDPGGRTHWGQVCPADYLLMQARDLGVANALVTDLKTGTVVSILEGGKVMAFRAQGAGPRMTFTVGNLVDIGRKVLPIMRGDILEHHAGAVDGRQRLWFPVSHRSPTPPRGPLDQWLVSVELADLFDPKPVRLPITPGEVVTIQAERSATIGTTSYRNTSGVIQIDSLAYVRTCSDMPRHFGCAYDEAAGDGFVVTDDSGLGHLGGALTYPVRVETAGVYQLSYQAVTFEAVTAAAIDFEVLGKVVTTPVGSAGGGWRVFRSNEDIELPAGTHVVTLSSPPKAAGWFLNSFSLQRL